MTKEEFYDSIDADTEFSFEFCRGLYSYSLYDPPFADKVIDKFRLIYGRDKVRYIYSFFLYWQIRAEDEEIKPAARELRERWERDNERRKRECHTEDWMNGMY